MKNIVKDWLLSAEGDLLLIQEIVTIENLTHLSAFHAQPRTPPEENSKSM